MRGHTLMQAIARVNRRFRDKPGGLVVDYLGLADELREAVASYTESGGRGRVTLDVREAVDAMREKYEVVRDLLHGFPLAAAVRGSASERMAAVQQAGDLILSLPDGRKRFRQAVGELNLVYALAGATDEAAAIRDEVSFFQYLRVLLRRDEEGEAARPGRRGPVGEDVDAAVRQIVSRAIVSDEVVDLFAAAGLRRPDLSILSDEFLEEVRRLPQKNLAVELLRRLIAGEVRRHERKNLVQSRSFKEMLENAIRRYENRAVETVQVIEELLGIARDYRTAQRRGEELGLSEEEMAFYDALEANESAVAVLGDEILRKIAQELTRTVRNNATIDWSRRESARSRLRVMIRRLLKKHGYPPDRQEKATDTVLAQAERLGDFFVESPEPAPVRPFRIVPPEEVRPFENAVPVYDLAAAAGRFSAEQQVEAQGEEAAHPERFEWAELPPAWRPRPGMFVAQVAGESMNRRIPNGGWCLFQLDPQGSREGKVVLVQHREIQDTETGGHYTLKRFHSEKEHAPDGTWRHTRIVLRPETDRDGYEPIVLEPADADEVQMIAELLGVIG